MSREVLYHGSKVGNLSVLKPTYHSLPQKEVVFASSDIRFALAMIYGSGEEIDVGYSTDLSTGKQSFYLQEQRPNAFQLLRAPGYVYEVGSIGFSSHPKLMPEEFLRESEVLVEHMMYVESVWETLQTFEISFFVFGENTPWETGEY